MPAALVPRDEVVARLQNVFRERGYDGASLSELSRATGLGKSSLYHYFPGGKDDMAIAVLERVDAWMRDRALLPLRGEGPPPKRLRAMLRALDTFYGGGRDACLLGTLVLGGGRTRFQQYLKDAFSGWVGALRDLAVEAGVPARIARDRAEDVVVRIEGALILAGALDDPAPFRRALRAAERDLLEGAA
ncbi:TetR family transcriptional regulator [Vulcanimicrobium alpinum]|uniref:TetR family transcriptional regulator n=1 Tax=Vulcanimicrobium alpinum TaxID=3016050 RepID=A0AAN1XZZ2_UNVUL|nr:TetR/AcrR family transcriptional regulator [Vulcanimicrobium alpinum]BDE08080.1 TetR family transcriptional regulator [Vulcanimicrobium alpinum]